MSKEYKTSLQPFSFYSATCTSGYTRIFYLHESKAPNKMQLNEVPQDGLDFKERDKLRKLMYAVDKDGHYTGVASVGWEAENAATMGAWDEVADVLRETEEAVRAGRLSPIAYFMQKCLMDVALLAKYAGKWQWTVRRHMKPVVFAKLSDNTLAGYAGIFNISIDELKNFGKQP